MGWGFGRYVGPGRRPKHSLGKLELVISIADGDRHDRRTALVEAGQIRRATVRLVAVTGFDGWLVAGRVIRASSHVHV